VQWEEDGVACKGYIDWLRQDNGFFFDLKTTKGSVHPDACRRKLEEGDALQEAAYRRAIEVTTPTLAGRVESWFVYAQTVAPFDVVPIGLTASMREIGESQWARALEIWSRCLKAGVEKENWPGHAANWKPIMVEASPWALKREMEQEY
jgi:hypothetical protein